MHLFLEISIQNWFALKNSLYSCKKYRWHNFWFFFFLIRGQGDSDLCLHFLCVSTVQIVQNHWVKFYHKSSRLSCKPKSFDGSNDNMWNVLCAVYAYSQLRTKFFSFHRAGKNHLLIGFLVVVGLSRLRLCLLLFFLLFILWLKFIWNHHKAALGLNLVGLFGLSYLFSWVLPFQSGKHLIQNPN